MTRARHRQSIGESTEQLVGLAYAAAEEPDAWSPFLARLADALNATAPLLTIADRSTDMASLFVERDCDPACRRAYDSHFIHLDRRRPRIQRLAAGNVFVGSNLLSDAELLRSEFYSDFLRPQGFFQIAGGIPLKDAERVGVLRVIRSRRQRPFNTDDLKLLRLVVPHVGRALRLHRQVASARAAAQATTEVLDWFPTGVILLSRANQVIATNKTAAAILAQEDGLAIRPTGLEVASKASASEFRQLLLRARLQPVGLAESPIGTMRLERPSGSRALEILVSPVGSGPLSDVDRHAAAVVFVSDPEDRIPTPVERVSCYLSITNSEAKLAIALAEGRSLADIAGEFGISVNTARTQRKRAMEKAGVHSQNGLVRLVLRSLASLAH